MRTPQGLPRCDLRCRLLRMADENDEERKYYMLKPKSFDRVNRPVHEEPQGAIDVTAMLQQNLAADASGALPQPIQPATPRSDPVPPALPVARHGSRRQKDYWTTLACAGGVLAVPAFLFRQSDLVLIGVASAFVLFAVLMAWIFWGIMDRY